MRIGSAVCRLSKPRVVAPAALAVVLLAGAAGLQGGPGSARRPYTAWSDYGGSADSMQYSALDQIDRSNVGKLELAWSYPVPGTSGRFGFNPLIADGVMYVLGKENAIVALDAATGKIIWTHPVEGTPTDRGINYWESKDRSDRRLIFSATSYLQDIDAAHRQDHPVVRRTTAASICEPALDAIRRPSARADQHARPRVRKPDHPRLCSGEGYGSAARRSTRLRRPHRQAGLEVPHRFPTRRVRLRDVAEGRLEVRRRHQHLGRDVA